MTHSLERKSLATQIYEDLRARIVTGELEPGTSLTLRGLARQYGVSATPVREGIRNLAGDGLIDLTSHLRPVVSNWGQDQVLQVLEARLMIEQYVVPVAVVRITEDELAALRRLNREIAELAGVKEPDAINGLLAKDKSFHLRLVQSSGNPVIERLYASLPGHLPTLRQVSEPPSNDRAYVLQRHMLMNTQHNEILAAYAARDVERAQEAVHTHLETIRSLATSRAI